MFVGLKTHIRTRLPYTSLVLQKMLVSYKYMYVLHICQYHTNICIIYRFVWYWHLLQDKWRRSFKPRTHSLLSLLDWHIKGQILVCRGNPPRRVWRGRVHVSQFTNTTNSRSSILPPHGFVVLLPLTREYLQIETFEGDVNLRIEPMESTWYHT